MSKRLIKKKTTNKRKAKILWIKIFRKASGSNEKLTVARKEVKPHQIHGQDYFMKKPLSEAEFTDWDSPEYEISIVTSLRCFSALLQALPPQLQFPLSP